MLSRVSKMIMKTNARGVTIRDIAEAAGVSHTAVSQALNGKGRQLRLSEDCAQRIFNAAKRLGYRRNAAAQAISTGRFNAAALVLSTVPVRSHLPIRLQIGAHDALAAQGRHLIVAYLPDERLTDARRAPKILTDLMCDGMILQYHVAIPKALEAMLKRFALPVVRPNVKRAWNCVYPDDKEGGRMLARRLMELGHRRVGYVDSGFEHNRRAGALHYSKRDRLAGVAEVLAKAGFGCECLLDDAAQPTAEATRLELLGRLVERLRARDRPTALIGYSPLEAEMAMQAAMFLRMRVGRDVSVAAVVSEGEQREGWPIMSAVLPEYAIGHRAAEMLMARMETPGRDIRSARLAPYFCGGETAGGFAPRKGRRT